MSTSERWTYKEFPLAAGSKAYRNGIACIDLTSGKVVPGQAGDTLLAIGTFEEDCDATAGEKLVNVNLGIEIEVWWWVNSGSGALAASDVGGLCYIEDDQTVTATSVGNSLAGRVWAVDPTMGVAVQRLTPSA